jgi:phosphatidylglycerol:prolipoprotein diacylglycerol transferase
MNSGYLHFPEFDPVIFSVGPVSLHWYGLMYLVGFIFAMWLAGRRASRPGSGWTKNEVENLLYAGFLGVFLGGRIGYVLFYNFPVFLNDPLYLFRVWDGGMSFHGGLIGVILVMVILPNAPNATSSRFRFYRTADPVWSGCGRLGNFINGELWGRVDPSVSFTMLFPGSAQKTWRCCRLTLSGNPFSIPTAFCRAICPSFMSWRWKAWCCLSS